MGRPKAGAAEFLPEFTHSRKTANSHFTRMNTAQKTGMHIFGCTRLWTARNPLILM
jgi:hypothetical protein